MNLVKLYTSRDCYDTKYARDNSVTVAQLIGILEGMPKDAKIILSNDNNYTFGFINEERIRLVEVKEEEEV